MTTVQGLPSLNGRLLGVGHVRATALHWCSIEAQEGVFQPVCETVMGACVLVF